ncbi:MAG: tRNA (adenosine(37)-N6)-threonylcarbamoyltransferase complex ATPase subunit type 1 TsaE [Ginsengibacter sp.]
MINFTQMHYSIIENFFELEEIDTTAKKFLESVNPHNVLAFSGELGAGKTTFIRAICKELNVSEVVTSPTYSIIQEYKTISNEVVFHIDLYRIKSTEEAREAGIEDCLNSGQICLVEWPERAMEIFPGHTIFSNFEIVSSNERKLLVKLPA